MLSRDKQSPRQEDPAAALRSSSTWYAGRVQLSIVLHKPDVSTYRIQLCRKDGPVGRKHGQSRRLPCGEVVQIEPLRSPAGIEVQKDDPIFRCRIKVVDTVLDQRPISPEACFQRADNLDLFAAVSRDAP